jgi:beta-mannosidase
MPSLDSLERASLPGLSSPADKESQDIVLEKKKLSLPKQEEGFSLDGEWDYLEEGEGKEKAGPDWSQAFKGQVPSSVHLALFKAGKIPDPTIGRNQIIARGHSYRVWWLKKEFSFQLEKGAAYILHFKGIADKCRIWLNGKEIGTHEGMFGGPDIDVTSELKEKNNLIVRLDPIPFEPGGYYHEENASWKKAVVINCVYGWHYSNLPSLGIWNSVSIEKVPSVKINDPFIFTEDAAKGKMKLAFKFSCLKEKGKGKLSFSIKPHNFSGKAYSYSAKISVADQEEKIFSFLLPDPQLWWPNDMGKQNLYELEASFAGEDGSVSSSKKLFGIRTLKMEPLPGGEKPDLYNWQITVNGKAGFIRGTGWCTMDALLDFTDARYDRFLSLAAQQHVQMLRAWGCGMPESDYFYQRCSELGIMVMQEWPTAWNSHAIQPYEVLKDTVVRNTIRLRDYPSLIMYGGGNESDHPFGEAIDMMLKASVELDGTRPFHRGEPWGGSQHDYGCYWGRQPLDHHLTSTAPFYGEFGLPSIPVQESFLKYMPKDSLKTLKLEDNPDFTYHTPVFGHVEDIPRLKQFASYFLPEHYTWRELIISTEVVQSLAVRRVLERARTRYPDCAGALYYKMNDNFPAVSWSCVDFYGAPKIAHYVFQDSFEPLHACLLFDKENYFGSALKAQVFLLDDKGELEKKGWSVRVQAFDGYLKLIKEEEMHGELKAGTPLYLGDFSLSSAETSSSPLFFVCTIIRNGQRLGRSFYFENCSAVQGSLFQLPPASLVLTQADGCGLNVRNNGSVPAVGVWLSVPNLAHSTTFSDNFLWLNPGEEEAVKLTGAAEGKCQAEALNCKPEIN